MIYRVIDRYYTTQETCATVADHADHMVPVRQHELAHVDGGGYVCAERSRSWNILLQVWIVRKISTRRTLGNYQHLHSLAQRVASSWFGVDDSLQLKDT